MNAASSGVIFLLQIGQGDDISVNHLIKPIDSSELKLPVKRNNIKLNNAKLLQNTGYKMTGVEESLRKMSVEWISR